MERTLEWFNEQQGMIKNKLKLSRPYTLYSYIWKFFDKKFL